MNQEQENFVRLYNEDLKRLMKGVHLIDGERRRINPDALGFMYKLLPYIHTDTNAIVHNPENPSREGMYVAKETELHKMTGTSRNTVKKYIKELKQFGVLAEFKINDLEAIFFNPLYASRCEDEEILWFVSAGFQEVMDAMERRDKE